MDEVQAFIARNKHQLGYIMQEASRQWAEADPVGALSVGPCIKQVEVYGEYFKLADDNERMREALHQIDIHTRTMSQRNLNWIAKKALGS